MPKKTVWVEAKDVKVGDVVRFRRMTVEVSVARNEDGMVAISGYNEDAVFVNGLFVYDKLIQKVEDEA